MAASRPYVADLLRIAGPVAVARLGIIGMALVDVIVVGQLAAAELPHQALGWAPTAVFLVAAIGLLQGVQVLAARALGEKNPLGAGVALRRGLVLAGIAGLLSAALMWLGGQHIFTVFGIGADLAAPSTPVMRVLAFSIPLHLVFVASTFFLEAVKKPGVGTAIMWGANIVNLALNLIWVPDLAQAAPTAWAEPLYAALRDWPVLSALNALAPDHGAVGSAWATVGARVFLAGVILAFIWFMRDGAHYGVRTLGKQGPTYRALLGVGIAAAVSQAAEAGAFSAMTVIAGRISPEAVSGYQIVLNLMALVFMVALGVSAAAAVLVSEAVGRKAPADATRAGWTALGLNTVAMAIAAILILIFARQIGAFYTADAGLVAMIAGLMWICALVLIPDGGQVVAAAALRARGDNWFPTFSHMLAYLVVMPVLGFYFAETLDMKVAGLLWSICLSSVLSVGILLARWWYLSDREARRAA
ncbi:MAG: MATE family efflux transporter [Phycisphaerales bacterium]|nr:MATE family efflux transporter [Hyphomonadaceae bacterium]